MRLYLNLMLAAAYGVPLLARADRREWMPVPSDAEQNLMWTPLALLALLAILGWVARNVVMNWWLLVLAMVVAVGAMSNGVLPLVQ